MSNARRTEREVKTALRSSNLSGTFVVGKYRLSPYMACEHACSYCDGRAERYYVEGDFGRDIVVRTNIPDLLALALPKLRERGFVTVGSGITDAYQPVEETELLTRRCAEVLAESRFPVTVMTKSSLVLRDLDVWQRVNDHSRFMLVMSLVHPSDKTRRCFEPGAASVEKRIEALRAFKEAGCAVGILAMPLLPGITDDEASVAALFDIAADVGVDFIQPGGLTLRPGRQKDHYLDVLAGECQELLPLYQSLYREGRPSGAPIRAYEEKLVGRCLAHSRRAGLPFLLPHRVYRDHLEAYDEAAVLIRHMIELYQAAGVDTSALRATVHRYLEHLEERKRDYNRHRSWDYADLAEEIFAPGALETTLENDKLSVFLRDAIIARREFDYVELKLEAPP